MVHCWGLCALDSYCGNLGLVSLSGLSWVAQQGNAEAKGALGLFLVLQAFLINVALEKAQAGQLG